MIAVDDNRDGIAISGATDTLPKYMLADGAPEIDRLRARFDEARSDEYERFTKAQRDRDYFDGPKQLNSEVRNTLRTRGQPPIYTNRVRPAVNGVLGVLEAGRRDPRAVARNPDDDNSADVATKALRYINDDSKFNDTQIDVAENFLIEGTGAVIVEMDGDKIVPVQIRWEEFYCDPYSRRADCKDARYMGIAKWKDAAEIREKYAVRINEIGDPLNPAGMGSSAFEDRPNQGWVDRRRKRVMLVEEYAIERGVWMRVVYIAGGILEYGPSPYVDDKNRPCNPIEAVSCYVDRENVRYGIVRDMVPIQDEVNASRSRSLHLMNSRQVQQTSDNALPVDADTARMEAAKPDGVLPMGWNIVPTSEMTQANMVRMQEAKSEIERMGPTPAVLGRMEGGDQSGRARLVSQQAGLTELARPLGRLHGWVLRVYEQMWNRAKQFWTDPMWIRVTDELKTPEYLKINEPQMGEVAQALMDPNTGQVVINPLTGEPQYQMGVGIVGYTNRPAEMDVDIILDQSEDTASLAEETWGQLYGLLKEGGGLPAIFSEEFAVALEISNVPDKRRMIDKLKQKREERQQAQAQQAQAQAEAVQKAANIAEAEAVAKIAKTQADTEKVEVDTALATMKAGFDMGPVRDVTAGQDSNL